MIIPVNLGADSYEIRIERGILKKAGELLDLERRVLVVTDGGVPAGYAEAIAAQCREAAVETVPAGEGSKSYEMLRRLHSRMLAEGFSRKDCVVAVGGGVVGDLAGFAAATYMRGVDFYNVPTTALSQVDSSVGGKTAIDLDGVKNVIGAFWQPKAVLIDPDTLATLPDRRVSEGLAEALKMSLTSDAKLFGIFEKRDPKRELDGVIAASVRIKSAVVEADEREAGLRRILNFGHTIGHGIESCGELHELSHGECVALGMIPMCGEELRKRLIPILKKLDLPVKCPLDAEKVYAAMLHDKKADGGNVVAIFVDEPGKYEIREVRLSELKKRIELIAQ